MRTLRPKLGEPSTEGGLYIRIRIAQCSLEDFTLGGLFTLNSGSPLQQEDSTLGYGPFNVPQRTLHYEDSTP